MIRGLTTMVLALALVGGACGIARAGDEEKKGDKKHHEGGKPHDKGDKGERHRKMLDMFDKNKDGKLDENERKAAKEWFREHEHKKHKGERGGKKGGDHKGGGEKKPEGGKPT